MENCILCNLETDFPSRLMVAAPTQCCSFKLEDVMKEVATCTLLMLVGFHVNAKLFLFCLLCNRLIYDRSRCYQRQQNSGCGGSAAPSDSSSSRHEGNAAEEAHKPTASPSFKGLRLPSLFGLYTLHSPLISHFCRSKLSSTRSCLM